MYTEQRPSPTAGPVRVTKNGNARTLTVPAEIVAAAGIELGDQYTVYALDGTLIYRRVLEEARPLEPGSPRGQFVGEGCNRYFELYPGAAVPAGPDPAPREPIDWDF